MKKDQMSSSVLYADLPDINAVSPLGPQDQPFLDELRQLMIKYQMTNRFGLSLMHNHFEIGEDEILVESCDVENRVLTIRPRRTDALRDLPYMETNWRLDSEGASLRGSQRCIMLCDPVYGHNAGHVPDDWAKPVN
ncbi:MAG: hypothetical protein HC880_16595 [Bacteroidia bacterium]|nr:hypothetical protein [Bacteroidia bacterium]